jgi:hypothetical protein
MVASTSKASLECERPVSALFLGITRAKGSKSQLSLRLFRACQLAEGHAVTVRIAFQAQVT